MAKTYTYRGREMRILDVNEPLHVGDKVMLRFDWIGSGTYSKATQLAAMETQLEGRQDFQVLSYVDNGVTFDVDILVKEDTLQEVQQLPSPWNSPWPADPDEPIFQTSFEISTGVGLTVLGISLVVAAVVVHSAYRSAYLVVSEAQKTPEGRILLAGMGSSGIAVLILVLLYAAWKLKLIK